MKLDRNIEHRNGLGKYALIKLRDLEEVAGHVSIFQNWSDTVGAALQTIDECKALDWGNTDDSEFFVIRFKDHHAAAALSAYARSAEEHGETEWAAEVRELATKAAMHPDKKVPD